MHSSAPSPPIHVTVVIGTRPEAIKLLPVVRQLRRNADLVCCRLVSTGQHLELLQQVFDAFQIAPDVDLHLMEPGQKIEDICARSLLGMAAELRDHPPDMILVEGDTTTVFSSALAAFWAGCPVGHVEAGLRSGNLRDPFPEEMNRVLTGCLSDLHFAPTQDAAENLRRAGVPDERIHVTGNTVIDALLWVSSERRSECPVPGISAESTLVLVTVHRRESFGKPLLEILAAIRELVERFPALEVVLPVHPNPHVKAAVETTLCAVPRVHLVPPLGYLEFVGVLQRAHLVLTDSGGVQEEAPALGKPVLVLRNTTERPEGVAAGVARLVGTQRDRIVREAGRLLEDHQAYTTMARRVSPYGDGRASERIVRAVLHRFGLEPMRPEDFRPLLPEGAHT